MSPGQGNEVLVAAKCVREVLLAVDVGVEFRIEKIFAGSIGACCWQLASY